MLKKVKPSFGSADGGKGITLRHNEGIDHLIVHLTDASYNI